MQLNLFLKQAITEFQDKKGKNMKLNNRGMTLVEMIVAFAILGLVSTSIFSMMTTGTKTYTKLTNAIKVQYDAQLASAKIERQILNCNDAIYWTADQVFMVENETVHAYCLNPEKKTLYYGTGMLDNIGNTELTMYMLAENVNSMSIVNEKKVEIDESTMVKYLQLQMELERNGKIYAVDKTVSLRNMPEWKQYELTFVYLE